MFLSMSEVKEAESIAARAQRIAAARWLSTFEIPNIIELAAMQLAHGKDAEGQAVVTAFQSTSFTVGRGPNGEVVLSLTVGQTGAISFLLPDGMPEQIIEVLAKSVTRH